MGISAAEADMRGHVGPIAARSTERNNRYEDIMMAAAMALAAMEEWYQAGATAHARPVNAQNICIDTKRILHEVKNAIAIFRERA